MKKVHISKSRVQIFVNVSFFMLNLVFISASFASGDGTAEPSLFKEYFWKVINFGILVALLVIMIKKFDVKGMMQKRTELIEKTLREATEARELAQKALAEIEKRVAVKEKEIEEILSSARHSGEEEKAKIIQEGNALREKIIEQTRVNIEYELREAKSAIKAEAVQIAMELAEKKIRGKLSKKEQEALLEESIAKIEGRK